MEQFLNNHPNNGLSSRDKNINGVELVKDKQERVGGYGNPPKAPKGKYVGGSGKPAYTNKGINLC